MRSQVDHRYEPIDHPWISSEHMPVYRWTFPEVATDDELEACFEARRRWAARVHSPVAWVVDVSNVIKAPATQRRAVAEHMKSFEDFSTRWNAGSALVCPTAWLRGIVTAAFWIAPPKFPTELFATFDEAEAWAKAKLKEKLAESGA